MHNEVEVIAQTCHETNRAFAAATGNPGLPNWANSPESQRNATRNRVTAEMQRLRTGAPPGSGITGRTPGNGGGADEEQAMQDRLFGSIVRGFWEAEQEQERLAATAA